MLDARTLRLRHLENCLLRFLTDPRNRPGLVRTKLCLYGNRDAAKSWQQTLTEHLLNIGFKGGRVHISVFHHPERNIRTLVHGDVYCSAGARTDLDLLQAELEKAYGASPC